MTLISLLDVTLISLLVELLPLLLLLLQGLQGSPLPAEVTACGQARSVAHPQST